MRVLLFLLAANLLAADLPVHHATIAVRDLKQMQSQLAANGIVSEYGGKGKNGLIEIAFATFADGSYLELIGAQKPTGAAAHPWGRFIGANAGPCAWGLFLEQPPGVRWPHDDEEFRSGNLNWEPASFDDMAPEGRLVPYIMTHGYFHRRKASAPGFAGISFVVVAVRNLYSAIDRYTALFHLPPPEWQNDKNSQVQLAAFPGSPFILASSLDLTSPLATHVARFGEGPYAVIVDETSGGRVTGETSHWFGDAITWISSSGTDHPWIGVRTRKR